MAIFRRGPRLETLGFSRWPRWKGWIIDLIVVGVLYSAGAAIRLKNLDRLELHFDAVDPFMRAHAWICDWALALSGRWEEGWFDLLWPASAPWLGQFGPGLAWSYSPLVAGATSVEEAFARRYLVQALAAPLLYATLRWGLGRGAPVSTKRRWFHASHVAALVAALAMGFCGETFGTAGIGDQTYLAPDMANIIVSATFLAMAGAGITWLFLAMALWSVAVMVHPYAVSLGPGLFIAAMWMWRRGNPRAVLGALALCTVASIPELIHVEGLVDWKGDQEALSSTVGFVSEYFQSPWGMLGSSARAWLNLRPRPLGPLLFAGPWLVLLTCLPALSRDLRRGVFRYSPGRATTRPTGAFRSAPEVDGPTLAVMAISLVTSALTLLALGLAIGLLHPYHWRVLLPGFALVSGLAVYAIHRRIAGLFEVELRLPERLGMGLFVVATIGAVALSSRPLLERIPAGGGDIRAHRWMASIIHEDTGTASLWLDAVVLGFDEYPYSVAFTPAIYTELRMSGVPRSQFHLGGSLYLAVNGPVGEIDRLCEVMGWGSLESGDWRHSEGYLISNETTDRWTGVDAIGRYATDIGRDILLVRLVDQPTTLAWTNWLFGYLPYGEVHLMLDSIHYMPLTSCEFDIERIFERFDPEMLQFHWDMASTPEIDP